MYLPIRSSVLTCILLVCCTTGYAQSRQAGQLSGSVRDQTGALLPGVSVTIRGPQMLETQTNASGIFEIRNLRPGEYDVTAALNGFETARRTVRLEPDAPYSLSFTLQVALLEQVIVTAAKTGEADVQSIPSAVSAVTNAELTRIPVRSIEHAARLLPSVTFTQNTTFGQLSIRGIGSTTVNAGSDPSSAMYLDGVYLARPAMTFVDLLDLERIEVLRGPQGTLYGRNALGGALNLISRLPTNEVDASFRLTAGNLGQWRADGRVSGPLHRDRVMGSLVFARGVRNGYVRDLEHSDRPLGADDVTSARGQLRVVGKSTEVLVSSDVSDQRGTPLTYNKVLAVKPGFQVDNPADFYAVRTSTDASARVLQHGASARLTAKLTPSTTIVSLTAFRDLTNEYVADADVTELDLVAAHIDERQHQWSEEATVTYQRPRLSVIGGTFLFADHDHQRIEADQPQAGFLVFLDPRVRSRSAALFGQATFHVASALSTTAGIRHTRERKTIDNSGARYTRDAAPSPLPGSEYAYTDSILHTAWTPKIGVEIKLPDGSTTYVSATKGFKSGGFNASSTEQGRAFAPEWAWNYEAGLKTYLMDRRARLSAAAFTMSLTNLQVQTPVGIGVFDIRNAAAATIRGVEVEGAFRIGRGLDAGSHVTWLDARYDRYIAVAIGGIVGDVAGRRLNNAPEWSGRAWAEWSGSFAGTHLLSVAVDMTAQSTVFFNPFNDPIQRQGPYALLGARAEYGPAHRRWSLNAYAKNLSRTEYIMAAFATSPAAYGGRPGASREAGVQIVLRK